MEIWENKKNAPIGVFDSGVGGISVLRELVKILPNEDYIYFGDSQNAPYGLKTLEQVRELTFLHVEELLEQGAKSIVVACNTATSAAVRLMREKYPNLPLVGLEPALKPAVEFKEQAKVLVMATPMTIAEEKFHRLMARFEDQATILPLACPGLMEFVEAGDLDSEKLRHFLRELVAPYTDAGVDAIVLGCTHYPFIKRTLQQIVGEQVAIFDGGEGAARQMRRLLEQADLLNTQTKPGRVRFENSLQDASELALCRRLLELEI